MYTRTWLLIGLLLLLFTVPAEAQFYEGEAVEDSLARLDDLEFRQFLDESFLAMVARSPETIISLGVEEEVGLIDVPLDNISDAYQQDTQVLERGILNLLRSYDRASLSPDEQTFYDVYKWWLDDLVRGHEFYMHDFPVSFFINSVNVATENFFTEIHPLETRLDASTYITRLYFIETKFEQAMDNITARAEAGIIPPQFVIQWTIGTLNRIANARATETGYYTAFAEKTSDIEALDDNQRDALLDSVSTIVENFVQPAYRDLVDFMTNLQAQAPTTIGAWQYPDGDAYYTYLLRHHTTTDLTADEIHALGLAELDRIHAEMRVSFAELGYNADSSIFDLINQRQQDGETVSGSEVVPTFEALLVEAQANLAPMFSTVPQAEVVVIGGDTGGYYIPASLDGARSGAFYAAVGGTQPTFNLPSLLYHETVPGHHLQIAWAQELDLPRFMRSANFTGYVEGWALYAERLAWEFGWYDDDPAGNIGRLQYEAFRAARLVVDTGIHARQWTFNQAVDFFSENTGFGRGMAQGQIARYIVFPGQATAYMIGMLAILDARAQAQTALGDAFDIREFHDVVLNNGSVPLDILDDIVYTWYGE